MAGEANFEEGLSPLASTNIPSVATYDANSRASAVYGFISSMPCTEASVAAITSLAFSGRFLQSCHVNEMKEQNSDAYPVTTSSHAPRAEAGGCAVSHAQSNRRSIEFGPPFKRGPIHAFPKLPDIGQLRQGRTVEPQISKDY